MSTPHALVIFAASFLLAADSKPEEAIKKEKEKLAGKWDMVSLEMDGQKLPKEITKTMGATITATKVTTKLHGEDETPMTYTVDPSKSPKHIDFIDPNAEKGKDD